MAWSWNALESKSYKTMVESLLAIDTGYLILVRDTSNYLCTWKIPSHVWTWNHTDVNPHKSEWKHWINERMTWVFEHILIIMSGKQSLNSVKLYTGVNRWGEASCMPDLARIVQTKFMQYECIPSPLFETLLNSVFVLPSGHWKCHFRVRKITSDAVSCPS